MSKKFLSLFGFCFIPVLFASCSSAAPVVLNGQDTSAGSGTWNSTIVPLNYSAVPFSGVDSLFAVDSLFTHLLREPAKGVDPAAGVGIRLSSMQIDNAISAWEDLGLTHVVGPKVSPAALSIVVDLLKSGNAKESLKLLTALSKSQPRDPNIYLYTGLALKSLGRIDDAKKYFEASLSLSPDGSMVREYAKKYLKDL